MIGTVKIINLKDAREFIEKWHYSKKVPTGKNIFFGWYINEELYAVADYGIGVNSYQSKFLSNITKKPVTNQNLLELKRLCRIEPKNSRLQLTQFLSICHKELKKQGYRYIVSFSDPEHNHNGGVYKAANFKYLGKTNPEIHVIDKDGVKRHRRYPYRYAKRNNISIQEARKILNLEKIKTFPKDRWFIEI
jgi:hypothetical protein